MAHLSTKMFSEHRYFLLWFLAYMLLSSLPCVHNQPDTTSTSQQAPLPLNYQIDNEIVGDPVVDCEESMITMTFKTKKPFTGRIYVQGLADDDRCSRNFASNTDQSKFSMMIQSGDCTMQRQRVAGTLEGMMLSLTIVVSFHGTFVTKSDRAYRCMCFFRSVKRVTSAIDVNLIGTTELLDTAKAPTCHYSIHSKGPDGPSVATGRVGDRIFHVWECDADTHGFLVHSCSVDDGRGSKFDLLDIDGCAIDPIIQPDVVYDTERNRASVETFGYKFSDTTVLNYQCTIELCRRSTNECMGLTPPICGRHLTVSKRSIPNGETSLWPEGGDEGGEREPGSMEVKLNQSEIVTATTSSRAREGANRMDLLTTLRMLDSTYSDIGQLSVVEGQQQSSLAHPLGHISETFASTSDYQQYQRLSEEKPKGQDADAATLSHGDCFKSMLMGFVASVLVAVVLLSATAFLIARRQGIAVKFI